MKEKLQIDAVQMIRRIRDDHARRLMGKSPEEIIAFFSRKRNKKSARASSTG